MSHVFISYSHQDKSYCDRLVASLKRRGFEVWIDDRIEPSARWPDIIQGKLESCAAFLVVMTPSSCDSIWVKNEVTFALNLHKPIFALQKAGSVWLALSSVHCTDVRDGGLPPEDFFNGLAEVVRKSPMPDVLAIIEPIQLELVRIPAGWFLMGSDSSVDQFAQPNEKPQHRLNLDDFYISKFPITCSQYSKFKGIALTFRNHPVLDVSWEHAMAFCRWLDSKTRWNVRLPSEAEWEKAARGPDGRVYPWGNLPPDKAKHQVPADWELRKPVGSYPAGVSPFGVMELVGYPWEWTSTLYREYPYDPKDGREDLTAKGQRVIRGSSRRVLISPAESYRCAVRSGAQASGFDKTTASFRIVARP
jgi:formylglycine-generating enzyme required for sulfatase activity